MKIVSNLLAWLLAIAIIANTITFVLGIFYFFDFFLFKLWIAELVITLVIAWIKVHVSYMIFESKLED